MTQQAPDLSELLKRIEHLERAVEELRSDQARSSHSPLGMWGTRRSARRRVEAGEFVVRGADGTPRAKLGVGSDGWARLRLYAENGERCATLGVAPDGSARLRLYDPAGNPRAGLAVASDLGGGLVLKDPAGNSRVTLGLPDEGSGDLRILDQDGKTIFKAP